MMESKNFLELKELLKCEIDGFLTGRKKAGGLLCLLGLIANESLAPEQLAELKCLVNRHSGSNGETVAVRLGKMGSAEDFERCKNFIPDLGLPNALTGHNAMHSAVYYENFEVVRWLSANGVDVDSRNVRDGTTPLMVAIREGVAPAVEFLVENFESRLDFGAVDAHGNSVLRWLTISGRSRIYGAAMKASYFRDNFDAARAELEKFAQEEEGTGRPLSGIEEMRSLLREFEKGLLAEQAAKSGASPSAPSLRI